MDRLAPVQLLAVDDLEHAVLREERDHLVEAARIGEVRVPRYQLPNLLARGQLPDVHGCRPPQGAPSAASTASEVVTVASRGMMLSIEKRCHSSG